MKIKVLIIIPLTFLILLNELLGQTRKDAKGLIESQFNYEVRLLGVGTTGTKVIKVWSYGRTVEEAIQKCKKNAVAACLFREIPSDNGSGSIPAICESQDIFDKNRAFFDSFFAPDGKYLQYVVLLTDGLPEAQDRLEMKKGYKIGVAIQILYDKLRKEMENQKLARALDAGMQ